jgi:hypothetical protein
MSGSDGTTGTILIEVRDPSNTVALEESVGGATEGEFETQGVGKIVDRLDDLNEAIVEVCKSSFETIKKGIGNAAPDEMTIEFGVSVGGEGSVIISKVSAEASLTISATWKFDRAETPPPSSNA